MHRCIRRARGRHATTRARDDRLGRARRWIVVVVRDAFDESVVGVPDDDADDDSVRPESGGAWDARARGASRDVAGRVSAGGVERGLGVDVDGGRRWETSRRREG
jgi:hypothetical protein